MADPEKMESASKIISCMRRRDTRKTAQLLAEDMDQHVAHFMTTIGQIPWPQSARSTQRNLEMNRVNQITGPNDTQSQQDRPTLDIGGASGSTKPSVKWQTVPSREIPNPSTVTIGPSSEMVDPSSEVETSTRKCKNDKGKAEVAASSTTNYQPIININNPNEQR